MLDKNIAALLRDNARTVYVTYDDIAISTGAAVAADSPVDFMEDVAIDPPEISVAQVKVNGRQVYTYVTTLDLKPNDLVVVPVNRTGAYTNGEFTELALARVVKIDDTCNIKPESKTRFKWVAMKLDFTQFRAEAAENAKVEAMVHSAYKKSMRSTFRERLMTTVSEEDRALLESVLRPSGTILPKAADAKDDIA